MKIKVKIKNKEYEIDVFEKGEKVLVRIGDKDFVFGSEEAKKEVVLSSNKSHSKEIKASLSGTVSEIFLKEGDSIERNQKVLTLSAMKMENEIVSESKGKIKKIMIKDGDKVKEGDILIVLE